MKEESQNIIEMTRILTGEASDEEKEIFNSSLEKDQAKRKLFQEMEEEWVVANNAMVYKRINLEEAWKKQKSEYITDHYIPDRNIFGPWLKWAAAIVIGFGLSFYYLYDVSKSNIDFVSVETSKGETLPVELADGSVITLNQNSRLDYQMDEKTRLVRFYGEAYFDITPDAERPFMIEMDQSYVKVLGTKFNINRKDLKTKVTVREGSVEFGKVDKSETTILKTGTSTELLDLKMAVTHPMNVNDFAWLTHELVFDRTPLPDVFSDLTNTYDLGFEYRATIFDNCRLTANFSDEKLSTILTSIETIFEVEFESKNNSYVVKGVPCSSH